AQSAHAGGEGVPRREQPGRPAGRSPHGAQPVPPIVSGRCGDGGRLTAGPPNNASPTGDRMVSVAVMKDPDGGAMQGSRAYVYKDVSSVTLYTLGNGCLVAALPSLAESST